MSFWKDFRDFAMKGNVIDLAIAVVIGGAFGKIVSSLVNDILMPLLGILTGGINFSDKKIVLQQAQVDAAGKILKPANTLNYGSFIQAVIDFLIIAFCIFLAIRALQQFNRKQKQEAPAAPPPPSNEEKLLAEIRDLLKSRS
ncbi:large-conductance mechanosensitive channel protein MscL [Thermoflavifilum thermophilum]|uniref:Large-conductance mechanosensitive channel n=1 Tax=Thermoflavifilum thermophilum TaxID=1393122 RepID=A0A1I7N6S5_9BACT|nr:large-conductance mechanosensitive channel protein MscL [Thermoflavifilum thermophilum]SFV30266.1 large conductance mechanosensitive channel [Thermoflavifilum thermophilum]